MIAECTPNAGNYNLLDCRILSAFLRRHRKESGGLLMNVFTAALRAGDLALFVFCKGKDDFEGLLAIFAEEFVTRHGDPQSKLREHILQRWRLGMAARKKTQSYL